LYQIRKREGGPPKRMLSLSKPSPSVTNTFRNKDLPPSAYKMHTKLKELLKLSSSIVLKKSLKEPSKFSKTLYN
jgi:hypothetical protein